MSEKWRHRLTWLLLAAYLPLVLASVMHVHSGRQAAAVCGDCLHHVEHPAHLGAAADDVQDCLLCHLLSLPRVAAAAVVGVVTRMAVTRVHAVGAACLCEAGFRRSSPRAPPMAC